MNSEIISEISKSENCPLEQNYEEHVFVHVEKDEHAVVKENEKKPWFPSCPDRW